MRNRYYTLVTSDSISDVTKCFNSTSEYFNLECACGEAGLVHEVGIGEWLPGVAYALCGGVAFNYNAVSLYLDVLVCDVAERAYSGASLKTAQGCAVACLQLLSVAELKDYLAVNGFGAHRCRAVLCNVAHTVCLVKGKACKALAYGCLFLGVHIGGVSFVT